MATTYNDLYLDIRQQLVNHGISQPSLEAREIVAYVAGKTREQFSETPEYTRPTT